MTRAANYRAEPRFYDAFPVAGHGGAVAADGCPVCFWNLSEKEVVVEVAGRKRTLARGGKLNLQLPREFVWQANDHESRTEHVAADQAGLEIVIRR
jgi:hypothetical protein